MDITCSKITIGDKTYYNAAAELQYYRENCEIGGGDEPEPETPVYGQLDVDRCLVIASGSNTAETDIVSITIDGTAYNNSVVRGTVWSLEGSSITVTNLTTFEVVVVYYNSNGYNNVSLFDGDARTISIPTGDPTFIAQIYVH